MQHRLERSANDRVISGVCGGLAEYFQIDPTLMRAFFVVATILTAFAFVIVYIVLLILMPLPGQRPIVDDWIGHGGTGSPSSTAPSSSPGDQTTPVGPAQPAWNGYDRDRGRNVLGYILIALGLVFLLSSLGAFRFVQWQVVWPLALIALGGLLLVSRSRP